MQRRPPVTVPATAFAGAVKSVPVAVATVGLVAVKVAPRIVAGAAVGL